VCYFLKINQVQIDSHLLKDMLL